MKMELKIEITDYFSEDEIREIAEQELRAAFREQFQKEADVERVIVNLSLEYVYSLVAEQWDGNFNELLRDKVREAIEQGVHYYVFRRKNAWDRSESPAVAILDDECRNSRPLIRECVEKHIKEYQFHELDRNEIGDVIYDVIMERILNPKQHCDARMDGE